MTKKLTWLLLMALVVSITACETIQPVRDGGTDFSDFEKRIFNQERRIEQGIGSGELTRREAIILRDNLTYIKSRYSSMKADRTLTSREMARLDQMLDRNNRMIYNKKHNAVERVY